MDNLNWREGALNKLTSYFAELGSKTDYEDFVLHIGSSIIARSQNVLTSLSEEGNEQIVGGYLKNSTPFEYRSVIQKIGTLYIYLVFSCDELKEILDTEQIQEKEDKVIEVLDFNRIERAYYHEHNLNNMYTDVLKEINFPIIHERLVNKLESLIAEEFEELLRSFKEYHIRLLEQ